MTKIKLEDIKIKKTEDAPNFFLDNREEDLKKALWYLKRELKKGEMTNEFS